MLIALTKPDKEPVTLAEAKLHLHQDSDASDALITSHITAAREVIELETGCALVEVAYSWMPEGEGRELPLTPAKITSPPNELPILFTTYGFTVMPAALKAAILLMVGDLMENREASSSKSLTVNPAVRRLIDPFVRTRRV
jgi:hypothetical protein